MLWRGQFGTELLHDFHPPVPPSGLFWTAPIPAAAVAVDLDAATASMSLSGFPVPDAAGPAAAAETADLPAAVSLVMQWGGAGAALSVDDPLNGVSAHYQECQATIEWSAAGGGFRFVSDPAGTTVTRFAQVGEERTGFFAAPAPGVQARRRGRRPPDRL